MSVYLELADASCDFFPQHEVNTARHCRIRFVGHDACKVTVFLWKCVLSLLNVRRTQVNLQEHLG